LVASGWRKRKPTSQGSAKTPKDVNTTISETLNNSILSRLHVSAEFRGNKNITLYAFYSENGEIDRTKITHLGDSASLIQEFRVKLAMEAFLF
jgi:hypothetical protein